MNKFERDHPVAAAMLGAATAGTIAAIFTPLSPIGVAFVAAAAVIVSRNLPNLDGTRKWLKKPLPQAPQPK